MTTKVQLDEMEVTRAERLLAVILAVFALIGGLWVYSKLDEIARPLPPAFVEPTPQQARAISAGERAEAVLAREEEDRAAARDELELRREAYRTALDPGGAPVALERDYRQAQADFQEADRRVRRAGPPRAQPGVLRKWPEMRWRRRSAGKARTSSSASTGMA